MVDFTDGNRPKRSIAGYQPIKRIRIELHTAVFSRPEPTASNSLRCKLGFHRFENFEVPPVMAGRFVLGNQPRYCIRCNKVEEGELSSMNIILPKTKSPKSKLEDAIKYLRSESYGVYKLDDSDKEEKKFVFMPQDEPISINEHLATIRPSGIREVKDGLD